MINIQFKKKIITETSLNFREFREIHFEDRYGTGICLKVKCESPQQDSYFTFSTA